MPKEDLTIKTDDQLKTDLKHLRDELRDLRFRVAQNQHKDVRDIREKKRTIARILTILHAPKAKEIPKKASSSVRK